MSFLVSLIFQNKVSNIYWTVLFLFIIILFVVVYIAMYFKEYKEHIKLVSVQKYERRQLQSKIEYMEEVISLGETSLSEFYSTKMYILGELLCKYRERKYKRKKKIKQNIEVVKEWNISNADKYEVMHISLGERTIKFPVLKTETDDGYRVYTSNDEGGKIFKILLKYELFGFILKEKYIMDGNKIIESISDKRKDNLGTGMSLHKR